MRKVVRRSRVIEQPSPSSSKSYVLKAQDGGLFDGRVHEVVVGLDPSYTGFGVTVLDPEQGLFRSWAVKLNGSGVQRLAAVPTMIQDLLGFVQRSGCVVQHICLEGYSPGSKYGREIAGELCGTVKLTLFADFQDPIRFPTIVSPDGVKKFVTGKGGGRKDVILKDILRKWNVDFNDNNMADSYALARVAGALLFGTEIVYESEVLNRLTSHTER